MARNEEFFIHVSDTPKRLFISRPESIKGDALSPCCMTSDDVDYEMFTGKHPEILEICGMNQQSLEYSCRQAMGFQQKCFFENNQH